MPSLGSSEEREAEALSPNSGTQAGQGRSTEWTKAVRAGIAQPGEGEPEGKEP